MIELASEAPIADAIERAGHVPLPPYPAAAISEDDRARYQTMFAEHAGAIAAPTAGLHFTPRLVEALRERGHQLARVTLHVGRARSAP
jgi:S-adenosylmethionine:tRNA ribosyltransferase-isomerase